MIQLSVKMFSALRNARSRPWCVMLALGACLVFAGHTAPATAGDLLIFAAASLTNALNEVGGQYRRDTGHRVRVSFASSSTLARQIEQGAPADVFISANPRWMNYLAQHHEVVPASRIELLGNQLVLIAPRDSTLQATLRPGLALAGLPGDERLAMGDPDHVPAGLYAKAALASLGIWATVAPRIARTDNVRAALAMVERGETPLGIVYYSDTVDTQAVKILATFPAASHPAISYPAARTAISGQPAAADAYLTYLRSAAGALIFVRHGFRMLQ